MRSRTGTSSTSASRSEPGAPRAAIVAVGEELVLGEIVDTNSPFLAAGLAARGVRVVHQSIVGDDSRAIAAAVKEAARRAALVLVAGGLGPTADDVTRAGIAAAARVPLVRSRAAQRSIAAYFEQLGRTPRDTDRSQELVPRGARVIASAHGTAPAFELRIGGARVVALPGVPRELRALFGEQASGLVSRAWGRRRRGGWSIARRRYGVAGISEARLGELLSGVEDPASGVGWGTAAGSGSIDVYLRAEGAPGSIAPALDVAEARLLERVGAHVFAVGEGTLAGAVLDRLAGRGETLAVAESCTGGRIAAALTAEPGASRVFLLGAVTYANQAKEDVLGVSRRLLVRHGAVSRQVAVAMARGALAAAGADWAVSTTGVAGPGGGTASKPVGLVHVGYARADGAAPGAVELRLGGDRAAIQERAASAALSGLLARLR